MRTNYNLFIPVKTRALMLEKGEYAMPALIDFSLLPYQEDNKEFAPNTAYLSDSIVSQAFQDDGAVLPAGIHLHWELPQVYSIAKGEGHELPAAPNRWLVTRRSLDTQAIEKQWVIESDRFYPEGFEGDFLSAVPLPFQENRNGKPYRYMGFKSTLQEYLADTSERRYWADEWKAPLTAIGYGEPHFASFYPNCKSIFGMYDPDYSSAEELPEKGVSYEVIGWHAQTEDSVLRVALGNMYQQHFPISQASLAHTFRKMCDYTWGIILSNSTTKSLKIQLNQPITFTPEDPKKPLFKAINAFVFPAPVLSLITQKDLLDSLDLFQNTLDLDHDLDALWTDLLAQKWIFNLPGAPDKCCIQPDLKERLPLSDPSLNSPLKQLFQSMANGNVLSLKRLQNRYGKDAEAIFKALVNDKSNSLITPAFLQINAPGNVAWLDDPQIKDLAAFPLLHQDVTHNLLFNAHASWDSISKADFSAIFSMYKGEDWETLTSQKAAKVVEISTNQMETGAGQLVYYSDGSMDLSQNGLNHLQYVPVKAMFANKPKPTWDYGVKMGYIIPGTGKARLQHPSPSLPTAFNSIAPLLDDFLNFKLDFRQFKEHFGEKADTLCDLLRSPDFQWITQGTGDWFSVNPRSKWKQPLLPLPWKAQTAEIKALLAGPDYTADSIDHLINTFADTVWGEALQLEWILSKEHDHAWFDPMHPWESASNGSAAAMGNQWLQSFVWAQMPSTEAKVQNALGKAAGKALWPKLIQNGYGQTGKTPLTGVFAFAKNIKPGTDANEDEFLGLLTVKFTKSQWKDFLTEQLARPLWKELIQCGRIDASQSVSGTLAPGTTLEKINQQAQGDHPDRVDGLTYYLTPLLKDYLNHTLHLQVLPTLTSNSLGDFSAQIGGILENSNWLRKTSHTNLADLVLPATERKPLPGTTSILRSALEFELDVVNAWMTRCAGEALYSLVTLTKEAVKDNPSRQSQDLELTLGNTGTEAISAYLAKEVDSGYQSQIEDQLEAITFLEDFQEFSNNVGTHFHALRHTKGFRAEKGDALWTVISASDSSNSNEHIEEAELSEGLAHLLHEVNREQATYDKAVRNIAEMRQQLYHDWHKYMTAVYPPEDGNRNYPDLYEIQAFIKEYDIEPLQQAIAATGLISLVETPRGISKAHAARMQGDLVDREFYLEETLAWSLSQKVNRLLGALNQHNRQTSVRTGLTYRLKVHSGPKYYIPTNPHLLISGELAHSSFENNRDTAFSSQGPLSYLFASESGLGDFSQILTANKYNEVSQVVQTLEATLKDSECPGKITVTEQPWHPILMEWMANFNPLNDPNGIAQGDDKGYDPGFIGQTYELKENKAEYTHKVNGGKLSDHISNYRGRTFLSNTLNAAFRNRLENYLSNQIGSEVLAPLIAPQDSLATVKQNFDAAISKYAVDNGIDPKQPPIGPGHPSVVYNALRALKHFLTTASLTQELSGFNAGLRSTHNSYQLKVADPLGFEEFKGFAQEVRHYVDKCNHLSPAPLNDLNPIRSGAMRLQAVRIVDSFGRLEDLPVDQLDVATTLKNPLTPKQVECFPRISQPARLNLRWKAALGEDLETNSHPATNPICGWVIPNQLDGSLLMYGPEGALFGWINLVGTNIWEYAPNRTDSEVDEALLNLPHLSNLIQLLEKQSDQYRKDFFFSLTESLENIVPEFAAQHQSLALLVSRPLALIRVEVGMELKHSPAYDTSWNSFRASLSAAKQQDRPSNFQVTEVDQFVEATRQTYGFRDVNFPVRVGDYLKLNDGLIGYWVGKIEPDSPSTFFALQAKSNSLTPSIKTEGEGTHTLDLSLGGGARTLTCLFDPKGNLHAVSGVLPSKEISIPEAMYQEALQKMEVDFLAAPILTPKSALAIPLPKEPGYEWSFLGKTTEGYIQTPSIDADTFKTAWMQANATMYWELLLRTRILVQQGEHFETVNSSDPKHGLYTASFKFVDPQNPKKAYSKVQLVRDILDEIRDIRSLSIPIKKRQFITLWCKQASEIEEAVSLLKTLMKKDVRWLVTNKSPGANTLRIVSQPERVAKDLEMPEGSNQAQVEELFTALSYDFTDINTSASFATGNELIEGWLNLKKHTKHH